MINCLSVCSAQQRLIEFVGCFALTCGRPDCRAAFCAWCLTDCGDDAHQHVGRCRHRDPNARDRFYASQEEFNACQRARRERLVRAYLNDTVPEPRRAAVVAACADQLRELQIDL